MVILDSDISGERVGGMLPGELLRLAEMMTEVAENWNVEWKRKTRSTIVASRGIAVMG